LVHDDLKSPPGQPAVAPDLDPSVLLEENEALTAALALSRRRLGAMRDVAQALVGSLDLDALLKTIVEKARELTEADRTTLFLVDREQDQVWSKAGLAAGEGDGDTFEVIRLPMGRGIAGFVGQTGVALNLADAYDDPRFSPEVDATTGYRTKALLCTPIFDAEGRPTGVIQALNKRSGEPFTVEDERLLEAIGHQVSVALMNSLLFEQLKQKALSLELAQAELTRRIQELDLLGEIEGAMAGAGSPDELLDVVARRVSDLVGADASAVAVVNPGTGGMQFRAATGVKADKIVRRTLPPARGLIGASIDTGRTVRVDRAWDDPRHDKALANELGFQPGPLLAVPLVADGVPLGALEVMRAEDKPPFLPEDQRILELLATRVAASLAGARRRERGKRDEQLQTIGSMLSGIVHDFKTPMTVISGYVQLMAEAEKAEERAECADMVLEQTDMMTAMTRELLQFARGDTEVLLRKVYLQTFVLDVKDLLVQIFKGTHIEVRLDLQYRGAARFDEVRMKRALANLAKNAREAMGEQGRFTIAILQVGDQVEFTVSDTGPGLPPEIESRLFESFATHGKQDGTGLGLALVKKIIEDHQGEVRVESKAGQGVTFRLRLPL
jgi:signal transduction histidine kinase